MEFSIIRWTLFPFHRQKQDRSGQEKASKNRLKYKKPLNESEQKASTNIGSDDPLESADSGKRTKSKKSAKREKKVQ